MIGSLGKVVFQITDKSIKVFESLGISKKARIVAHERVKGKPYLQHMGFDAEQVTFTLQLVENVTGAVDKDLDVVNKMFNSGKAYSFFIGSKKIGNFIIESISEKYNYIDNMGKVNMVTLNITLKEYIG